MWNSLGRFILKYRIPLLVLLLGATAFMAYKAKELQLSYEFANAIPTDHPKYKAYQEFRKKFGEDGNMLVIGIQTDKLFEEKIFNDYTQLVKDIKKVTGVEDVISITTAVNLIKDSATEKLGPQAIFEDKLFRKLRSIVPKTFFISSFLSGLVIQS
jgi:predicted RND superfamily exporter protein